MTMYPSFSSFHFFCHTNRLTGFLVDTSSRDTSFSLDRCTVITTLTHGGQKFCAETGEIIAVGEKKMATFAPSLVFEILDTERTTYVNKVTVCLNNEIGSPTSRGMKRNLTYETELSMTSFRGRKEEKIATVVTCEFDMLKTTNRPHGKSDAGSNVSSSMLMGELGLSLVYTDDVEQPSFSHFLACGLCLCPPVSSMPAPSARPTLKHVTKVVS